MINKYVFYEHFMQNKFLFILTDEKFIMRMNCSCFQMRQK